MLSTFSFYLEIGIFIVFKIQMLQFFNVGIFR